MDYLYASGKGTGLLFTFPTLVYQEELPLLLKDYLDAIDYAVRHPSKENFWKVIESGIRLWIVLSIIAIIVLLIIAFS